MGHPGAGPNAYLSVSFRQWLCAVNAFRGAGAGPGVYGTHAPRGSGSTFHWKTILLPARIAEYVVVHEMAHLHEPHHKPEYWRRVERAMPDFGQRRAWLAAHGGELEGL